MPPGSSIAMRVLAGRVRATSSTSDSHRGPAGHPLVRRRYRLVSAPSRSSSPTAGLPAVQGGDHPLRHDERRFALGASGIRINCTAPGVTETPILDQLRSAYGPGVPRFDSQAAGAGVRARRAGGGAGVPEQSGRRLHHGAGAVGRRRKRREPGRRHAGRTPIMAGLSDFRRVADDVRNWGRWGDADELGTLNFITPEKVLEAAEPGQARQGLSARRRLRLVGAAGRVPLPAEPAARDDDRRWRRQTRCSSTGRSGCRTRRPFS